MTQSNDNPPSRSPESAGESEAGLRRRALVLIVLLGIVSLFSDMTYQGGRSLSGPFLGVLGANAAIVGLVAGLGEFLGFAARLGTGLASDRSRAYWLFAVLGYGMLAAVPLIGIAGGWQTAALFIFLERLSKAVRAPSKDTILSMAARRVGTGFGIGLHKVMDQTGAVIGPLVLSAALAGLFGTSLHGSYRSAFHLLWIPMVLTLIVVIVARFIVPNPGGLEEEADEAKRPRSPAAQERLSKTFWVYSIFTVIAGIGFTNFALLSFHAKTSGLMSDSAIPLWYAVAMGLDGLSGIVAGRIYDRFGLGVLFSVPLLSIPIPLLGFLAGGRWGIIAAIMLWGLSFGVQETVIKAGVADLTSLRKRGTGYGIFNAINGVGVLGSGALMGLLYSVSPWAICLFTIVAEVAALVLLAFLLRPGSAAQSVELHA